MKLSFGMKSCYSKEPQEPPPSSRSEYASGKVASLVDVLEEGFNESVCHSAASELGEWLMLLPDFRT
jgi:hypothetical protein